MSYMLLIIEPVGQREERGTEAGAQAYAEILRFTAELQARGVLEASGSLAPCARGVRVQVRGGQRGLIDGPFTEAKEMVGGFFLLNCATQGEAVAIAAECPAAAWCTVEVRETAPCFD